MVLTGLVIIGDVSQLNIMRDVDKVARVGGVTGNVLLVDKVLCCLVLNLLSILLCLAVDDQLSSQRRDVHLFVVGTLLNEDGLRRSLGGAQGINGRAKLSNDNSSEHI